MFIYIETNKSKGYAYSSGSIAEMAIRLENAGHKIIKIEDISDKRNGDYKKEFVFGKNFAE